MVTLKKAGYAGITLSSASGKLASYVPGSLHRAAKRSGAFLSTYKSLKDSHSLQNPRSMLRVIPFPLWLIWGIPLRFPQVAPSSNATRLC